MTNYEKALDKLFALEGFLSDNINDYGGLTFMGISKKYHKDWKGWKYVESGDYTKAEELVRPFYKENYWDLIHGDKLSSFNVAFNIFQIFVNRGNLKEITTEVQTSCYYLNKLKKDGIDGIFGNKTVYSVNLCEPVYFLEIFLSFSTEHYLNRVKSDSTQKIFLKGWLDKRIYRRVRDEMNNE